eukprot:4996942-Pyramimonas_sp.AAC.1
MGYLIGPALERRLAHGFRLRQPALIPPQVGQVAHRGERVQMVLAQPLPPALKARFVRQLRLLQLTHVPAQHTQERCLSYTKRINKE